MLGSNAPSDGASPATCGVGVSRFDGVCVGAARLSGKPEAMRAEVRFAACAQPAVTPTVPVVSTVFEQPCIKPGILPAIAVAWKVESVSNSHAYPIRTDVLLSG